MKLVFFSGGDRRENRKMHQQLLGLFPEQKIKRICFIPSCDESGREDFRYFKRSLKGYNIQEFQFLDIFRPIELEELEYALSSDVIHLSGGNTFYFLERLRLQKLISPLRKFVKEGGVLTGLSAGSILMTPNIKSASIPQHDQDENFVEIEDLSAMDLVPFEVAPHFDMNRKYIQELQEYSQKRPHPIYACPDGSGIIVQNGQTKFVGDVYAFYKGNLCKVF